MKTKLFYALSLCATVLFTACEENPIEQELTPELSVPESIELSAVGKTTRFELKSNTSWTFEGGESWLQVDPLSGEYDKRVALTPDDNTSINPRTCVLTVSTDDGIIIKQINVTQLGADVIFEASVTGNLAPEKNSEVNIEIKSNDSWTIEGETSWLRLSQVSGTGNSVVKVTALTTNYSQEDRSATLKLKSSTKEIDLTVKQNASWVKNCNVSINSDYVVFSDDIAFTCETSGDVLRYHYYYITKSEVDINNIASLSSHVLEMSTEEGYYADPKAKKEVDKIHYFGEWCLLPDTDYVLFVIAIDSEGQQGGMSTLEFRTRTFDIEKEPYAMVNFDGIWMDSTYTYYYIPVIPNGVTSYYYVWTTTDPDRVVGMSYSQVGYISQNAIKNNPNDYVKNTREWEFEVMATTYMRFVVWAVGADGEYGGVYDTIYAAPEGEYSLSEEKHNNQGAKKI